MTFGLPPLPPRFEAALRDVHSRKVTARWMAAEALGRAPAGRRADAIDALWILADDAAAEVRATALSALGNLRAVEALDLLLARFDDGDPTVRQVAMVAAADLDDPRTLDAFRRALTAAHPDVRFQAVDAIAALSPDAGAELAPRVDDDDDEVRAQLADVLGTVDGAAAAEALGLLLGDPTPRVQRAAALSLARRGDGTGLGLVLEAIDDAERRYEAVRALGLLGAEEAAEPLARLAGSLLKPLSLRAEAGAALVRLGDRRGVAALRQVLGALRSEGRSYAAQLVGELGLSELAPHVAALAQRPRGADPLAVATALSALGRGAPGAEAGLRTLAARDDEAGAVARRALGTTDAGES
ncbi:MAG: HEAT repeat domain-containing protein [Sandaracinaceae bacterium]